MEVKEPKTAEVQPDEITFDGEPRQIDGLTVATIAVSIGDTGQQYPVAVMKRSDGSYEGFAGRHRVAACKQLGVPVKIVMLTDRDTAERWALDENSARQHWDQEKLRVQRLARKDLAQKRLADGASAVFGEYAGKEVLTHRASKLPYTHPTTSTGVGRGAGGGRPKKLETAAIKLAAKEEGVSVDTIRRAIAPPKPKHTTKKPTKTTEEPNPPAAHVAASAEVYIDLAIKSARELVELHGELRPSESLIQGVEEVIESWTAILNKLRSV